MALLEHSSSRSLPQASLPLRDSYDRPSSDSAALAPEPVTVAPIQQHELLLQFYRQILAEIKTASASAVQSTFQQNDALLASIECAMALGKSYLDLQGYVDLLRRGLFGNQGVRVLEQAAERLLRILELHNAAAMVGLDGGEPDMEKLGNGALGATCRELLSGLRFIYRACQCYPALFSI